jgi:hypothetical protein
MHEVRLVLVAVSDRRPAVDEFDRCSGCVSRNPSIAAKSNLLLRSTINSQPLKPSALALDGRSASLLNLQKRIQDRFRSPHAGPFDHVATLRNVSVQAAVASDHNLHPVNRCPRRLPVSREARKSDQSH